MPRQKVNVAWIEDKTKRNVAFKKRRNGLMKKVSEIASICNIDVCAVVRGPDEAEPKVWPPGEAAAEVARKFRAATLGRRCQKMMDHDRYLQQQIAKLQRQLKKREREYRERRATLLMRQCLDDGGSSLHGIVGDGDATDLAGAIKSTMERVQERIELLQQQQQFIENDKFFVQHGEQYYY